MELPQPEKSLHQTKGVVHVTIVLFNQLDEKQKGLNFSLTLLLLLESVKEETLRGNKLESSHWPHLVLPKGEQCSISSSLSPSTTNIRTFLPVLPRVVSPGGTEVETFNSVILFCKSCWSFPTTLDQTSRITSNVNIFFRTRGKRWFFFFSRVTGFHVVTLHLTLLSSLLATTTTTTITIV